MLSGLWLKLKTNYSLIIAVFIFLILSWSPIILGFFIAQKNNFYFTGAPIINTADHFIYLSNIEQGKLGHIFLQNLYNHGQQGHDLFSPHWYILGQISNLAHISVVVIYQLAKFFLQIIFIYLLYWWVKKIFNQPNQYWWILLVLLTANGLGSFLCHWYKNLGSQATNIWMPESITFLSLQQSPLLILSQILLLLIFALFIKAQESRKNKYLILAGLSFFTLITIHPYDLPIILVVLGVWSTFVWQKDHDHDIIKNYIWLIISAILPALYYMWLLQDPVMAQWKTQNVLLSPNIYSYFIGFGLVTPLALGGIIYLLKDKTKNLYTALMLIWAIAGWGMVYLPLDFSRRLSSGWHIPLCIIALIFAQYLYKKSPWLIKLITLSIFSFLLIVDTLVYTKTSLITATDLSLPEYFQKSEQIQIYRQIELLKPDPKIFMTRGTDGSLLPAFTGQKVYVGHPMNTWQAEQKNQEVKKIWTSQQDITDWLKQNNIDYIYASRIDIPEFDDIKWLAHEPYITPLIDDADTILYQFTPQAK